MMVNHWLKQKFHATPFTSSRRRHHQGAAMGRARIAGALPTLCVAGAIVLGPGLAVERRRSPRVTWESWEIHRHEWYIFFDTGWGPQDS